MNGPMNRREAFRNLALFFAGSPLVKAQQLDLPYTPERLPSIDELVNVFEFEPLCRYRIPKNAYDYIAGGVDAEWTLRRNREAFDRITFRPRMLTGVSNVDLSIELWGRKAEMPIFIAPTAAHQLAHPEGELATVRAAAEVRSVLVVSSASSYPIEKISAAAGEPPWFQLYAEPDLDGARERVGRAVGAGCKVIFFTVDGPFNSHRERLLRNRIAEQVPPGGARPQPQRRRRSEEPKEPSAPYRLQPRFTAQLDWKFLDTLSSWAKLPIVVKGILTAEDARLAVQHGAAGIVVSNHGGRYLEFAPATIEVLPEIVDAVGGKIPVLIDSGFRRGTDVLKGLALGAKAVLVGRPPLWGLGAYGQAGVKRVMELLQAELALALALAGRPNLQSIDPSLVRR